MSNQYLKLRRSAVPGKLPDTASLDFGEIALNTYDGKAYMKRSGSNGEEIIAVGSVGSFTGSFSGSFEGPVTGSLFGTASWAVTASHGLTASSADNFLIRQNATASNILVTGTLTAQTIVAQVITASTEYITGSTIFGSQLTDTHQFTGSVTITGSLAINGVDYESTSASFDTRILANSSSVGELSSSFLVMSGSTSTRLTNLEFFSSSLDATFATDAELNAATASLSTSIAYLSSSYLADSASFDIRILSNSSSIATLSGSFLNTSSSLSIRVTDLELFSSSLDATFATDAELNAATASLSTSIAYLSSSYLADSSSFDIRILNNSSSTAILSGSFLNASGSLSIRVTDLELFSSSLDATFATDAELNAATASLSSSIAYLSSSYLADSASFDIRILNNSSSTAILSASYLFSSASFDTRILANSSSIVNLSSSFLLFTGSYNTGSFTGSFNGQFNGYFSGSVDNIDGQTNYIAKFDSPNTVDSSVIYQSASHIAINEVNFTPNDPEALYVFQTHPTSFNVITGKGNSNNYLQLNIQNTNQGISASSDIVATANNGTEGSNYIDMGINGENYTQNFIGGANDAYLYSIANNLHIGNAATNGSHIGFFVGGDDVQANNKLQLNPNNEHELTGSLNISSSLTVNDGITGSLFGTSSWALNSRTASYIASANVDGPYGFDSIKTASLALTASTADNFFVRQDVTASNALIYGTLTAQTIVAQVITSSTDFVTGSTRFGSLLTNTHQFTGSVSVTGSLSLNNDSVVVTNTLNLATASLSSSIAYLSSSYLADSGSFDLRILNNSSSIAVLSSSFLNVSSSNSIRLTDLELFSSSLDATFATDAELNAATASLSSSIAYLSSSYLADSASFDTRILNNSSSTAILSSSFLNTSGSISIRLTDLEFFSSSLDATFATDAQLNQATASLSGSIAYLSSSYLNSSTSFDNRILNNSSSIVILSSSFLAFSGSYNTGSFTGMFSGSHSGSFFGDGGGLTNISASSVIGLNLSRIASGSVTASVDPAYGFKVNSNTQISGSTQITGSLGVTGSVSITGSIGSVFSANVDTLVFTGSLLQTGSIALTGSMNVLGGISASLFGTASWAQNAVTASTADNFFVRQNITASNALITGTLTAQTIVAQVITSSTDFVTGSTRFGSSLTNTHQFTGSVSITGSLEVNNSPVITDVVFTPFSSSISLRATNLESTASVLTSASASFAQQSGSNSIRFTSLESTASVLTSASASFAIVSGSFVATSGSLSTRTTNLESTASVLTAASSSFSTRVTTLESASSSFAQQSGSNSIRFTNLESTASILTNTSASFAIVSGSYSNASGSISTRLTTIEGKYLTTGSNVISGSQLITGSIIITGSISATQGITASLFGTASWALNAITASHALTASYVNPLRQTVILSGALDLTPTLDPDPTGANLRDAYLFVSSSNTALGTDLYVRQDGNISKWKWIEGGSLNTGILFGGVVTYSGSFVYISSGSGIIVDYNANTGSEISPIINYVNWNHITASVTNITSSQVTYLSINSAGALQQQQIPFTLQQYSTSLPLGAVGHFNYQSVSAFGGLRSTAYAQPEQANQFIDAFGPLKVGGYPITGKSGSLQLSVGSGTSFIHGGFYQNDPEFPSIYDSPAQLTGSIVRCYMSGSATVFDTNNGSFYNTINPGFYNEVGAGITASVSNNNWTVQRVFSYPANNSLYVYYGQIIYSSFILALDGIAADPFVEGSTKDFTTFIGYLVVKSNATSMTDNDSRVIGSGLFRASGAGSGGGSVAVTSLDDLSDVSIVSPSNGQALIYNSGLWINGNPTSASFATTASYVLNAVSASFATSSSRAISSSFAISASFATTASFAQNALTASHALTASSADNFFVRQNVTASNALITGTLTAQTIIAQVITSSTDFVTGSTRFGSLLSNTHQFTGSVTITGSLSVNNSPVVTDATFVPFSSSVSLRTTNLESTSSVLTNASASFAIVSGSFVATSASLSTRTTALETASSSFAQQSGSNSIRFTNLESTASVLTTASASFAIVSASYSIASSSLSLRTTNLESTSSNLVIASGSISTRLTTIEGKYLTTGSNSMTGSQSISGSLVVTGSVNFFNGATGSLFGTASWASNAVTASHAVSALSSSYALSSSFSVTSSYSLNALTASHALTASSADAFKVRNSASVTGSLSVSGSENINGSGSAIFSVDGVSGRLFQVDDTLSGSLFSVNTVSGLPIIEAFSDNTVRIGQFGQRALYVSQSAVGIGKESALNGKLDVSGSAFITGSLSVSLGVTASLFGTASWAQNAITASHAVSALSSSYAISASYSLSATSSSFATTASYAINSLTASHALTASSVNTLRQNVLITGSLTVGSGSIGNGEHTLIIGPASSGGPGEGGQVLLSAVGGTYTSASMLDNYQNRFRILRGTNASSDNEFFNLDLDDGQLIFNRYTGSGAFPGTTAAFLAVDTSGNVLTSNLIPSASYALNALTASHALTASSADSFLVRSSITASNALITGTLTAQTIIAQVITSSTDFVTGSTRFGSLLTNTHQFTGSVSITGSLSVNNSPVVTNDTFVPFSSSVSLRATNLESTASVLTNASSSFSTRVTTLEAASSSFAQQSGSNSVRFTNLESTASVLTIASASFAVVSASYSALSASFRTGSYTGSFTGAGNLTGSLFGTASWAQNSTTSSYSLTALSSSYAQTASFANNFTVANRFFFDQTLTDYATVASSIVGSNNLFTQATGSYTSAFFKYTVTNTTNARTGEVMAVWNGGSIEFTDYSTVDLGVTSPVSCSVSIVGADVLFNVQTNTSGWKIKSIGTFM